MAKKGNKKNIDLSVPPKGSKGLLITCDINKLNQAKNQIMNLLERFSTNIEVEIEEKTLEEEIKELKNQNKNRFIPYISSVFGNFFIRFVNEKDDPFEILQLYFDELKRTKNSLTTKIIKIIPILYTGFPNPEESLPILQNIINNYYNNEISETYEVFLHRKHYQKETSDSHDILNKKILQLIPSNNKAVYHNAKSAIVWVALGRNLFLSVIPKWNEWCSCNIPKFCQTLNIKINEIE